MRSPGTSRLALVLLATSWVGLVLGVIIVMSSTFGVLLGAISADFGWSRGQLALAYSLFSLTSTLAMPLIGRLVDRNGARRIVIGCVVSFAVLTSLLGLVTQLWQFYALFVLLGIISGGTSSLPYFKVLVRAFAERRGLALGLANSGTAIGNVLFPFVAFKLNEAFGWRATYLALGIGVAVITVVVMLAGLRERELAPAEQLAARTSAGAEPSLTLSEAMSTPQFWLIGAAFFVATTALVGYFIHLVPLMKDRGLAPETAALAASTFGGAQFFGRLCTGFLLDRLPSVLVVTGLWLLAALSFVLLWAGVAGVTLFVCAALAGLAFGGEGDVLAYFASRLFGPDSFGRIYSVLLMINLLGGVAGPWLFGVAFDATGSYTTILGATALTTAFAVALILCVRTTTRPHLAMT
jgi:predicted MFS family arabinose efflux permease